jgi:predicted aconitase with swiveling domain
VGGVVTQIAGSPIVAGSAQGAALVTDEPLSMWGGLDPETGEIIDRRHPLSGRIVTGRVLVLPHGRGSCSASGVLLEAIRNDAAPAAIVVWRLDPIIGLGAILAEELYARTVPVVLVSASDAASLSDGDLIEIDAGGRLTVSHA